MKRWMCALLALCLLALGAGALAENQLKEVQMLYEDYDGHWASQTVDDEATVREIEAMLTRAHKNPGTLEGNTMNCTLLCTLKNGEIYDIAVATDGSLFITDMTTDKTYRLTEDDHARLWEIFDVVQEEMGYDAALFMSD